MAKNTTHPGDRMMQQAQVARYTGKSQTTIKRWRRQGVMPAPDGRDPLGNPWWWQSTIDRVMGAASPSQAA